MYFPEKPEILKGRGVHDYGILRAWGGGGGNAFWNFRRQGGVKTWKPSVVGVWIFSGIAHLVFVGNLLNFFVLFYNTTQRELMMMNNNGKNDNF